MNHFELKALLAGVVGTLAVPAYAANPIPAPMPAPVANPVRTQDAFARTPARIDVLPNQGNYIVPDGHRLVIETASAFVQCNIGATGATATWGPALSIEITVPMSYRAITGDRVSFRGSLSARLVLEPGAVLLVNAECDNGEALYFPMSFFGYFVSVMSPSLAP